MARGALNLLGKCLFFFFLENAFLKLILSCVYLLSWSLSNFFLFSLSSFLLQEAHFRAIGASVLVAHMLM